MTSTTIGGGNRTGTRRAPEMAAQMIAATRQFPPSSSGDDSGLAAVRAEYAKRAEPMGTMPPPAGLRQMAKTAVAAVVGKRPNLFLDKLGERLAFERNGVRLYDALLGKLDVGGKPRGGPSREDLAHIRAEELAHARMIQEMIVRFGGDPTALTPSANLHANASKGLCAVMADPRTDLVGGLEAILVAELVDNDCWTALIELARNAGERDAADRFGGALEQEREHLEHVRSWLAAAQGRSVEAVHALSMAERRATASATPAEPAARPRRGAESPRAASARPGKGAQKAAARGAKTLTSRAKSKAPRTRAKSVASRAKAKGPRTRAKTSAKGRTR